MTLSQATGNIKTRLENLTETINDEEITVIDRVIHGRYNNPLSEGIACTIQAESEGEELNFAGGTDIPSSPFNVPLFISIWIPGAADEVMPRLYDLVKLVKDEFRKDMTFGGTCTASFAKPKSVLYTEAEFEGEDFGVTATILIDAYFA